MLNFINFLYPNLQQIYILMINHGVIILIGKLNLKNMSIKNKKNNITKWIRNYTNSYKNSVDDTFFNMKNIYQTLEVFKKIKKNQKIHIFGNGGSSTIASHFSMDLTNNSNIVCLNYNDPAIITCYSNDFGYRDWIARVINKYGNKNDIFDSYLFKW